MTLALTGRQQQVHTWPPALAVTLQQVACRLQLQRGLSLHLVGARLQAVVAVLHLLLLLLPLVHHLPCFLHVPELVQGAAALQCAFQQLDTASC